MRALLQYLSNTIEDDDEFVSRTSRPDMSDADAEAWWDIWRDRQARKVVTLRSPSGEIIYHGPRSGIPDLS